jgi:hypothetical protein
MFCKSKPKSNKRCGKCRRFGHSTEEPRDQKKEPKETSGGNDEKRGSQSSKKCKKCVKGESSDSSDESDCKPDSAQLAGISLFPSQLEWSTQRSYVF